MLPFKRRQTYLAKVFSLVPDGNLENSIDRGLPSFFARVLTMQYVPFPGTSTSYQSECGVFGRLFYQGFPEPPSDKRKLAPHFCFANQQAKEPGLVVNSMNNEDRIIRRGSELAQKLEAIENRLSCIEKELSTCRESQTVDALVSIIFSYCSDFPSQKNTLKDMTEYMLNKLSSEKPLYKKIEWLNSELSR